LLERTYRGLLAEENHFRKARDGLRLAVGSTDETSLLTWIDLKREIPLHGAYSLGLGYLREQTWEAQRDLFTFSFQRRFGERVEAAVILMPHFYKPEIDLAAAVSFRAEEGTIRLEVTSLDTFSELAMLLVELRDVRRVNTFIDQRGLKLGFRMNGEWTYGPLRTEFYAGATLPHTARVDFPNHPLVPFRQRDQMRYVAALLEARPLPKLAVGGWGAGVWSRIDREVLTEERERTFLTEGERRVALYLSAEPLPWLFTELLAERVLRPERGMGRLRRAERHEGETALSATARVLLGRWGGVVMGLVHDRWTVDDPHRRPLAPVVRDSYTTLQSRVEVRLSERTWARFGANFGFDKLYRGGNLIIYSLW
jgi:hypothetical protein